MADRLLHQKTNITDATGATCMTGVSGDSQVILSVSICETAGADESFNMYHSVAGGGTPFYIYKAQSLPANSTFIHSDKIVVDDTQQIWVQCVDDSGNLDVIVTYLQQDD